MRQRRLFTPSSPPTSHATGNTLSLDAFVFHIYLPHIKVYKRSWRTDARIASRHLSSSFGACPLARISRGEIEDWLQGLLERGFAPASCNRFLAVLKTIYTVAENRGILPPGGSPCRGISGFRASAQKERYLSRHEAESLMRALKDSPHPHAQALQLLLLTGARKNEILKARWENMDLERGLLTIPVSKSGRTRHIVLSEAAIEVIRNLPRTKSPWLFPGHAKGKALSDVYLFWNSLRRELGLRDVRIHDLRHSFASFLVNAGHTLYEVQKMLGHADPRTTMRYAHLEQATLRSAAEAVSDIFATAEIEGRRRALGTPRKKRR